MSKYTKRDVILAVAGQLENLMYNGIDEEYGLESFEGWCEDGEVFTFIPEFGEDEEFVNDCVELMKNVAPMVDILLLNHLNPDNC